MCVGWCSSNTGILEGIGMSQTEKMAMDAVGGIDALDTETLRTMLHECLEREGELKVQNDFLQAERADLVASRDRYLALYDRAPVGYLSIGEAGVIGEANLTATQMLGTSRSALLGQSMSRFISEADHENFHKHRLQLLETGEVPPCELRMVREDETVFWACLQAARAEDEAGAFSCKVAFHDISVRKEIESYRKIEREVLRILNESGDTQDFIGRVLEVLKARTGVDAVGIRLNEGEGFKYFVRGEISGESLSSGDAVATRAVVGEMCQDTDGTACHPCTCALVLSGQTDPSSPIMTKGGSCWTSDSAALFESPAEGDSGCHPLSQCIQAGYLSVALVPIRTRDRVVGLIHLNGRRKGCFTLEMVEILEGVAWQIGEALLRKQTEALLEEATVLLKKTSRIARIGGWELDVEGGKLEWTDETYLLHEVGNDYRPNVQDGLSFYPPESRLIVEAAVNDAIEKGAGYDLEVPFVTAKGRRLWVKSAGEPEFEGTKCVRISGIFQDITERKEAEENLKLLRTAIEQSAETIVITDTRGNIEYVNPAFEKITGYSSAEVIGQNPRVLRSGEQDAAFYRRIWETIGAGQSWRGEFHNRRKDGSLFWESATISPVLDTAGQIRHYIAVKQDITERKAMEAALEEAVLAAEAGNRAKTEFLSTMSHELRTPLNGVLGFCELLTDTPLDEEQASFVHTIESSGEHLLSIVNDILDFTSIENHSLVIDTALFPIARLVKFSEDTVKTAAIEKGLAFRSEVAADVPEKVLGDERRVSQIVINLLGNAVKFASKGSIVLQVGVSKGDRSPMLEISVEDSGVGMSSETISCLFTPFLQADSKLNRAFGGTGLGLAISQRLAKRMGGEISVLSTLGKGSKFTLRLPLVVPQSTGTGISQPVIRRTTSGVKPLTSDGLLVLVVEDDPDNSMLAGKMLESLGYDVEFAADGAEAVKAFSPGKYFAILMDVQMPVMNGIDATARIRQHETGSHVPILGLTASVMPDTSARCLAHGMDDILSKPFKRDALAAMLSRFG